VLGNIYPVWGQKPKSCIPEEEGRFDDDFLVQLELKFTLSISSQPLKPSKYSIFSLASLNFSSQARALI